jgi:hypothetical protein
MSVFEHLFGSNESPQVVQCTAARESFIHDFLSSRPGLSAERKSFFQDLAKEDQKPYCNGSKETVMTDSSPVALTGEQLARLVKLPYGSSDK